MTTTKTITIGKTTYSITSVGSSPLDIIDAQGYVEGPRGSIKCIICFSNGCTRVVSHSRSGIPSRHVDMWGDEAKSIAATLTTAM